ncbi:hypothetical protein [Streptosporangium roseum]|uniref:hypothetical protein n=1 Tax=Streptosporangium roseum TaxID=2001 RepID=UPI0033265A15
MAGICALRAKALSAQRRFSASQISPELGGPRLLPDLADQAEQGTCCDKIEIIVRDDRRMKRMSVALVVAGLLSVAIPGGAVHAAPESKSLDSVVKAIKKQFAKKSSVRFFVKRRSGPQPPGIWGLIGHKQISITLNRYTHVSRDRSNRARTVFADFSLASFPEALPIDPQSFADESAT